MLVKMHDHALTAEEVLARVTTEPIDLADLFKPMTEEQIVEAGSRCHACTMADWRIPGYQHCGGCYCCKT